MGIQPLGYLVVLGLALGAPSLAAANAPPSGGVSATLGGPPDHHHNPSHPLVALECTGPNVPAVYIDPKTGRREHGCKCAAGAKGELTRNPYGRVVLRCLRQMAPRP